MSTKSDSHSGSRRGSGRLQVVHTDGRQERFLRGMLTHDLVQRGLDFDTAYATARAVRDRLTDHELVTTAEIRDLLDEVLEKSLGAEALARILQGRRLQKPRLHVIYDGRRQPFSRGLLARSMLAAGVDLDRAYGLVTELEGRLREDAETVLNSEELARRVGDLMEQREGPSTARRYRLMRRIRRLPRPLIMYVGGASGTGKSTLSLELAPLLHIHRINSTDTIRQVMRMVFSPQILPDLHVSSFEAAPADLRDEAFGVRDGDARSQVLRGFEEQAVRIRVGVRAVVDRALAENMNILVEGVHLYPPLVPFQELEGAAFQVSMMLGTLDSETLRARLLGRSRLAGRRAERYLERFDSILEIQDFLLQQAETHDVPLLDTSASEVPVTPALRLATTVLQRKMPRLADPIESSPPPPTLLLIIDGLADRPVRALGARTPLQAARIPTLDRLATEGRCGQADPIAPGFVADTAAGSLALFGQSPFAMKRGPVEALGAGLEVRAGDVALRGNFATLDEKGWIVDRRAGRIRARTEELAAALDRMDLPGEDVEIRVAAGTEHRLAIVLRGGDLSSAIRGSDPGDGAPPGPPLTPEPLDPDDREAAHTARLLALFERRARSVLARHPVNKSRRKKQKPEANAILTRGPGKVHRLIPLEHQGLSLRVACVAGDRTILGLASWSDASVVTAPEMTANLDTDLGAKFEAAAEALAEHDLVLLHVKGADIAGHDLRPDLKTEFLERVDASLGRFLEGRKEPLRIAIGGDHATLSEVGQHSADPMPVLIWGEGIEADEATAFDEVSVVEGALGRFPLQMLLGHFFDFE